MKGEGLRDPHDIRSIHVYHLNHIGDMVFSLPLLASIKYAFPKARIVSVIRPGLVDLWQMSGLAHDYLVRGQYAGWIMRLQLVRALRKRHPDISFVLSQGYEANIMAYLSTSPIRVGFRKTKFQTLLTHKVEKKTPPSTQNNLRLLEALGITPVKQDYVGLLRPFTAASRRMDQRLNREEISVAHRLIVLSPGASLKGQIKEWTDEGFAALSDHFSSQPDTEVAIIGTVPADGIVSLCKQPITDLTCKTNMQELVAILDRADLVVGVDSGALHIAAALGTPVVGIYGPSDPDITGPQGMGNKVVRNPVPCSPCFKKKCPIGRICLVDLKADQVIQAAEDVLNHSDLIHGPDSLGLAPP